MTKTHLLGLDWDEAVLKRIARVASLDYTVMVTGDVQRLQGWLGNFADTAVVLAEQSANGLAALQSAQSIRPGARRILLTTYEDLAPIIEGLHSGVVQVVLQKPFTDQELFNLTRPAALRASA